MQAGIRLRIIALAVGLSASALLGGRRTLLNQGAPGQELSWPCPLGSYSCVELRDPQVEKEIRTSGGRYRYREYQREADRIEFWAIAAPAFSYKDPSYCLRLQGWTVLRSESRPVLTAAGWLPAREYVLATSEYEGRKVRCAIGLWRWGDRFFDSLGEARFRAAWDALFHSRPRLVSIQVAADFDGPYNDTRATRCFDTLRRFLAEWPP